MEAPGKSHGSTLDAPFTRWDSRGGPVGEAPWNSMGFSRKSHGGPMGIHGAPTWEFFSPVKLLPWGPR